MGGSFDKKGGGYEAPGKRPTPVIEGTATEVVDDPEADDAETTDTSSDAAPTETSPKDSALIEAADEPEGESDQPDEPDDASPPSDDPQDATHAPAPSEHRSFGSRVSAALVSLFTHAVAGLVGGLAVLAAIIWGLLPVGPPANTDALGQLSDRVSKLETASEAPETSAALDALKSQVGSLQDETSKLAPEVADLTTRVSQLEESLKSIAEAAEDGGSVADAAAISQQISDAEARLDDKIKEALAGGGGADGAALAALQKQVDSLDAKMKALAEAKLDGGDASSLQPEVTALAKRLDQLEATVPELASAVDTGAAETKTAAAAIAFANLSKAVNDGSPYGGELATLTMLSGNTGDLGNLPKFQDTGIPTLRQLTSTFAQTRTKALAAEATSGEPSLLDRLIGSAESLVKVTRVDGAAEGNAPDAILARAGAKLNAGDLSGAVSEIDALEGAPAKTFEEWLAGAKARLNAPVTLRRLQDTLLASLAGGAAAAPNGDAQE